MNDILIIAETQKELEVPTHLVIKFAEKLVRNGKAVTINKSEKHGMEIIKILN